jgi:chorismate mutase/prephenate dehydratase
MTKQGEFTNMIRAAERPASAMFPSTGIVACQGVEGAYSQLACDKLFSSSNIMYFRTWDAVFQAVQSGLCEFGVLPIENSSSGSVNGVYDLLGRYDFSIVRSVNLYINHFLMAKPGVKLADIREIYSHEYALEQCSAMLEKMPNVKATDAKNTAIAAQMVAESERTDVAAISSRSCAELYGLDILQSGVQNNANNYTRFICIAKDLSIYPGANKISLTLSVPHKPGSLYDLISKFAVLGINMAKLESRPIPGSPDDFKFYVDLDASVWTPAVIEILEELSQTNPHFAFLGSYTEV